MMCYNRLIVSSASRPPTSVVSTVLPMNEQCDTTHPNKAHPTDCRIFYQCAPTLNGLELIEKTCGPTMMYNPISQVCDWPGIVFSIRPECMFSDTTKVTITTQAPTTQDGELMSCITKKNMGIRIVFLSFYSFIKSSIIKLHFSSCIS